MVFPTGVGVYRDITNSLPVPIILDNPCVHKIGGRSVVVVPKIWTPSRESILVFQHEEKPQWGSREDLARSSKQV